MNNFPEKALIIDSILKGITQAQNNYSMWIAHDLYLSYAPTNFLTIHVAQEIAKINISPEIFIDATIEDILKSSLLNKDTFKSFMTQKNILQDSISITLDERFKHENEDDSISKVIITLKNGVKSPKKEYLNDIDLLCKLLSKKSKKDSTLEYGVFAFYIDISNTSNIKIKKRLEQISNAFDSIVESHVNLKSCFTSTSINKIDNIGEWCVGCYVIESIVK